MRLTSDQFWDLTPAQFQALSKRREAEVYLSEDLVCFAAGIVSSTILNVLRKKGDPAIEPSKFVPNRAKKKAEPKRMTAEQIMAHLERVVPRN